MIKQIEVHGRRVKLYSLDEGRTWSSNPQSIVAYGQRKKTLSLDLRKRFERMDARQDRDPKNFTGLEFSKESQIGKEEES
jgi:hypothetical protein